MEEPERLSKKARTAIENADAVRELSAASIAEIAIKFNIGKLQLGASAVWTGLDDLLIRVLPCTAEHAWRLFDLPLHHRDPLDRQIIAQALAENIPVATPDPAFRRYKGVHIIW